MIGIIGLEKILKTYGFNANQVAQKLGISRQTVYDWLKGKRNIPLERIEQLSKFREFNHIDKSLFQKELDETDQLELEHNYLQYLSAKYSEEVIGDDGIRFTIDPYENERRGIEQELYTSKQELKNNKKSLSKKQLDGLSYTIDEAFSFGLAVLSEITEEENGPKLKLVIDILSYVSENDIDEEKAEHVLELLKRYFNKDAED